MDGPHAGTAVVLCRKVKRSLPRRAVPDVWLCSPLEQEPYRSAVVKLRRIAEHRLFCAFKLSQAVRTDTDGEQSVLLSAEQVLNDLSLVMLDSHEEHLLPDLLRLQLLLSCLNLVGLLGLLSHSSLWLGQLGEQDPFS